MIMRSRTQPNFSTLRNRSIAPVRALISPRVVAVTDTVLNGIDKHLAAPNPEQGGALLRPVSSPLITRFLWDSEAETSGVSYVPSEHLVREVEDTETLFDMTLTGVVHSHPAGMNRLSGPDLEVTRHLLQQNRHLGTVTMPIVTQLRGEDNIESHESSLTNGRITWFFARLDASDRLIISKPTAVRVLPVDSVAQAVAAATGWRSQTAQDLVVAGHSVVGLPFIADDLGATVWVLLSSDFPIAAPLIAVDDGDGITPTKLAALAHPDSDTAIAALIASLEQLRTTVTKTPVHEVDQ